jgi:ATP-dependent Lon protease
MPLKLEQKQEMLEMDSTSRAPRELLIADGGEIDILQVEKRIRGRVKRRWRRASASTT